MMDQNLSLTIVQYSIEWEDALANKKMLENLLEKELTYNTDVIILPEMFSTGFSMSAERLYETMDGPTIAWMRAISKKYKAAITGSLIIKEHENYYNRLIWIEPDIEEVFHYNKRHCFALANEDEHFTAGDRSLHVLYKGWKIAFYICYDLRFPEWIRDKNESELLIFVANWPEKRNLAWKTLTTARAIENVAYVAACNRIGVDGLHIPYSGDSRIISFDGQILQEFENQQGVLHFTLKKESINAFRRAYPFLKDQK